MHCRPDPPTWLEHAPATPSAPAGPPPGPPLSHDGLNQALVPWSPCPTKGIPLSRKGYPF